MHDTNILRQPENALPHSPADVYLGDKAYGGFPHLLVPRKASKHHPRTQADADFESLHSLARARSEHFFARMGNHAVCRRTELEDEALGLFYRFVAKLEAHRMGPNALVDKHVWLSQVRARSCGCRFMTKRDRELETSEIRTRYEDVDEEGR